ncbi:MAG TPA: hypothetical protein VI566_15050, partial [Xanthomonadales bacterium]|nr:hypothetical protein [Xanthomonadales bacterium]
SLWQVRHCFAPLEYSPLAVLASSPAASARAVKLKDRIIVSKTIILVELCVPSDFLLMRLLTL